MNTHHINKTDNFQNQSKLFKTLLKGAKMAKLSSFLLIAISLILAYKSRESNLGMLSLLIGAVGLIIYIFKFLSLNSIEQKSYTQMSLVSSISKFKSYIVMRRKYEMYFIGLWILSLIPMATSSLNSRIQAILFAVTYIVLVTILGNLAYKKIDKTICSLEAEMQISLNA